MATRKNGDDIPVVKGGQDSQKLLEIDFATGEPLEDGEAIAEQSSFYSRDPDLKSSASFSPQKVGKYTGVERRKATRRAGTERRTDVRFETDKADRRQCHGRRAEDTPTEYW